MWNEINSDEDIKKLMEYTHMCDDFSTDVLSVSYNGTGFENSLLLTLDKNFYFDKMEMLFEGVRHFRFSGRNDSSISTINGYSLEIRTDLLGKTRNNKLIVWTDGCKVEHRNGYFDFEKDNCIVIADSLKYRFIEDTKTEPESEKSLKEIVEENYLIEITWDNFWKNFDESLKYGIKSREDIKPFFESYSMKYFPESSETLIVMTIKFFSAENEYLGYYDLLFDKNLEIKDDFFVIE